MNDEALVTRGRQREFFNNGRSQHDWSRSRVRYLDNVQCYRGKE